MSGLHRTGGNSRAADEAGRPVARWIRLTVSRVPARAGEHAVGSHVAFRAPARIFALAPRAMSHHTRSTVMHIAAFRRRLAASLALATLLGPSACSAPMGGGGSGGR